MLKILVPILLLACWLGASAAASIDEGDSELFLTLVHKHQVKPNCTAARRAEIAKIMLKSQTLGRWDFIPPRNDKEFLQTCRDFKTAMKAGKKYIDDCMIPFAAQIASVVMKSVLRTQGTVCSSKRLRAEALEHLKCLTPESMGPLHECAQAGSLKVSWLAYVRYRGISPDHFMPALCCVMHSGMDCVLSRAEGVCAAGGVENPQDTAEYISNMFSETGSEAMELFCGKFSGEEQCYANLPTIMEQFALIDGQVAEGNFTNTDAMSMIMPLIHIFQRKDLNEDD